MLENNHSIICFGEVLWDILPTGPRPGGAPMNVCYHLHKQGEQTALITKIGNDEKGRELRNVFATRGLCIDFFQVDHQYGTGRVFASPNHSNEVEYDIVFPSAWDFISLEEQSRKLVSQSKYFVYGSLAARHKVSRDTLYALLDLAHHRVLDINLRAPHFEKETIAYLLATAQTAKLNLAELELITGWYGSAKTIKEAMQWLQDEFFIDTIIVTRGADGAIVYSGGQFYEHTGYEVIVEDTIGSGDAFLAAFLSSLTTENNIPEALFHASRLGAFIATQSGACPDYTIQDVRKFLDSQKPAFTNI